ncbi:MAG: diphosphate--fructose-6-phosphate 1-phosphotransferase [Clostridiales bacterium]|jgi:6-phosphofructokinase 1|nr:diphosphate--fructose-6-phosphate 1-phosphotransferase [Clostridiales bacterium]
MARDKLVVVHGGAPTAVLNASLYGVIDEARKLAPQLQVLGARHGTGGLLKEDLYDLSAVDPLLLPRLLTTPGSVIGSSRTPLQGEDYAQLAQVLRRMGAKYVLFNGGNGTMDACGKLRKADPDLKVIGIPKTIDNDIAVTDHAPGFGSAARYLALAVRDIAEDVRSLPIHISVVEAMGRNAGWLAAAASLAGEEGIGADLIIPPELPFDEERFLDQVQTLYRRQGCATIVVSEGLKDDQGMPIVPPLLTIGRAVYYGDISAHLAKLIIERLNIKARSENPGIAGRAGSLQQSESDRQEAEACGREALRLALAGKSGLMVTISRADQETYRPVYGATDIESVMLHESSLPTAFLKEGGDGISDSYKAWCRPLVGPLPDQFFDRRILD